MSVIVEHSGGESFYGNDCISDMKAMFGAMFATSSSHKLVNSEVSTTSTRLKQQRSRENTPTATCTGCGNFSPELGTRSPKPSPRVSPHLSSLRVKHFGATATTIVEKTISSCPVRSISPSVCDQLKGLRVGESHVLSPEKLASRIENPVNKHLLLDCRPFIAYNMVHIDNALSLNCCDRLTRKRLQCGKIRLVDIISGQAGKEEYKNNKGKCDIIIYDEETRDLDCAGPPSPLKLVVNTLKEEGQDVFYLKGGLSEFREKFETLCVRPEYKPESKLLYSPTTPNVVDDQIDTAVVSEILPYLYIGNCRDVGNYECLKKHGVTHVLNVTSHVPLHFESQGIIYKRLPASDSGHQNLKQYFDDAFQFIEEAKKAGGKVLVHCQAGVSRSATIAISYIMKNSTLSMLEAFRFIKSKRSIVAPNFNFMGQLYELEQMISDGKVSRPTETPIPVELLLH